MTKRTFDSATVPLTRRDVRWTCLRARVTIAAMHRPLLRSIVLLVLVALGAGAPARAQQSSVEPGDPVVVVLTTGDSIYGELVSRDASGLVIRVAGVDTTVRTEHVERVTRRRTPSERYRSMRAIIDDDDTPRLLLLCEWLIGEGLLGEARHELDTVLDREPTNPDAARMSRLLDQRIVLRDRAEGARPARGDTPTPTPQVSAPGRFEAGAFPLLSDEQVNLLKVYELDLSDPPRVLIDRDTVERFMSEYAGAAGMPRTEAERRGFYRKNPTEILELMFRLRARELYTDVKVLELPNSLALFRDHLAGAWLTRSCASTSCHGGTDAPPPHLFNKRPFSETTALTNFIILDRFRLPGGEPLIDYDRPGESPLLQLGLPRPVSSYPHPEANGWRPAFRSRDVLRFRQGVDWINAMIRPRPDVPIAYEPPNLTPEAPLAGDEADEPLDQER